ncbi:MAG: cache domain-containing protein [Candidatus Omnitrophica bacterium]|nr:cache domain-containing protein [Candidatus Omnitrophota bacterium]
MKTKTLNNRIQVAFLGIIVMTGILISLLGAYVVKKNIIQRAQLRVRNDLNVARALYADQITTIKNAFELLANTRELASAQEKIGLDYLFIVGRSDLPELRSEIARQAFNGRGIGGTRVIGAAELERIGGGLIEKARIAVKETPQARPFKRTALDAAMAIEYALPLGVDSRGTVESVVYGGKVINRDTKLVDTIRDLAFGQPGPNGIPAGTVTIFQDDVRIATNVPTSSGERAIGTRVSAKVYDTVVLRKQLWVDRAFVVNAWYLTAYEPIKDIAGNIIGILYVGIAEKPFRDSERNIMLAFLLVIILVGVLAAIVSSVLAASIARPVTQVLRAARELSKGALHHRVKGASSVRELNELVEAFNSMAHTLAERELSLKVSNEQLAGMNKSYLDMIGFVSHELKGILGSIVINIYSVKDGYLGPLTGQQKKAVDAAAKSLDHFEDMVRNYLDLSRIEKGELTLHTAELDIGEEVILPAVGHLEKQAQEKSMRVECRGASGIKITADKSLLTIVCNNLLGNALKYGKAGTTVRLDVADEGKQTVLSVYNEGDPITGEQQALLFRRFSRLPTAKAVKGTGLGLFIVKAIVEKHGGTVQAQPQPQGNMFIVTLPKE